VQELFSAVMFAGVDLSPVRPGSDLKKGNYSRERNPIADCARWNGWFAKHRPSSRSRQSTARWARNDVKKRNIAYFSVR